MHQKYITIPCERIRFPQIMDGKNKSLHHSNCEPQPLILAILDVTMRKVQSFVSGMWMC